MQQVQQLFERVRDSFRSDDTEDAEERDEYNRDEYGNMPYHYVDDESGLQRFRLQGRSLLIGAVLGLLLGLLIGWVISPVQWEEAQLIDLSEEAQANYLAAVADAYVSRQDETAALVARQRLFDLNENLAQEIAEAQQFFANSDIIDNGVRVQNLQELAQSLGVDNEVLAINRDLVASDPDQAQVATEANAAAAADAETRGFWATLWSWLQTFLWLLFFAALIYGIFRAVQALRDRRDHEGDGDEQDDEQSDSEFDNRYREQYDSDNQARDDDSGWVDSGGEDGGWAGSAWEDEGWEDGEQSKPAQNPLAFQPERGSDSRSGRSVQMQGEERGPNQYDDSDSVDDNAEDDEGYANDYSDHDSDDGGDRYTNGRQQEERTERARGAFQAESTDVPRPPVRIVGYSDDGDANPGDTASRPPAHIIQPDDSSPPIRIQPVDEPASPAAASAPAARSPSARTARASTAAPVLDEQRVRYQFGQPDFEETFSLKGNGEASGSYIGHYGVAPRDEFGIVPEDPDRISVLDVWLHDHSEPDGSHGQSQLLISRTMAELGLSQFFEREEMERYRPLVAEQGARFTLETQSLLLEGEVERAAYLTREGEVEGIFREVVIKLTARQKA